MTYILDASVSLRWELPGPHSIKALQFRDDYLNKIHQLIAPDTFSAEVASALTKAERQKLIPVGRAAILYTNIAAMCPVLHSYFPLTARAITISSQTRAGFYDCLYVALAEKERCELVSLDDKLVNNLQKRFPFVIHLATLP